MLMGEAFQNGPYIALDDAQKLGLYALEALYLLALPGNFVLLISCPPKSNVPGSYLLYALCVVDFVFFLNLAILGFINSINGGYATGKIGCKIHDFTITLSMAFSMLILSMIAFERHLAVCYKRPLKMYEISGILFLVTVLASTYGSLAPFSSEADISIDYQKQSFICTPAWYAKTHFASVTTIWAMVVIPLSITYICIAYFLVYKTFRQAFNAAHHDSSSSSNHSATPTNQKKMEIFKTCLIITGVYFGSWSPYLVRILMEIATGQPVNESFATASEVFAILNSLLDPYILMIFDNRIRGIMMKTAIGKAILWLFKKKPKRKTKQNSKQVQKGNQVIIKNTAVLTQDDKTRIIN